MTRLSLYLAQLRYRYHTYLSHSNSRSYSEKYRITLNLSRQCQECLSISLSHFSSVRSARRTIRVMKSDRQAGYRLHKEKVSHSDACEFNYREFTTSSEMFGPLKNTKHTINKMSPNNLLPKSSQKSTFHSSCLNLDGSAPLEILPYLHSIFIE